MRRVHAVVRHLIGLFLVVLVAANAPASTRGPVVLAAASLQEAMTDAGNAWAARGHAAPVTAFAGSSTLARQIESDAPADLFVSADEAWMDDVAAKGLIRAGTRTAFLSNRLVLIAPISSVVRLRIGRNFPLAAALGNGRLVMADPDAVPAGIYAKAALSNLGVWSSVAPKIVRAENVRAALALVERGEAPLGIVYATDARASSRVRVVGIFPVGSHPAITYPLAIIRTSSNPDAAGFRRFLLSRDGAAVFARRGFITR